MIRTSFFLLLSEIKNITGALQRPLTRPGKNDEESLPQQRPHQAARLVGFVKTFQSNSKEFYNELLEGYTWLDYTTTSCTTNNTCTNTLPYSSTVFAEGRQP